MPAEVLADSAQFERRISKAALGALTKLDPKSWVDTPATVISPAGPAKE